MTTRLTLRMREVSELTGASRSTLKRWVDSGALPHSKPGGVVLIRPADLEAFLEAHWEGNNLASRRARNSYRG